ncbi:uncharacterized protein LOC141606605 [Silene latifolia]|uniref:uncharacterized protein LOC141606605 n=1 Tax=Silene latifolia TaxID=37657 RepID=UPI003D777E96
MDYGLIFNGETCTIDVPGEYIPIVDWLNGIGTPVDNINGEDVPRRIVPATIEHQGDFPVCWGYASGRLSETAHINAGQLYEPASIQDLLDHGYLPRESMTGHAPTALEYTKVTGVCLEGEYRAYTGKPPGVTDPIPPHNPEAVRRRIHDWYPVENEEKDMLAALQKDVLLVSVSTFESFVTLKGKELLDMAAAEYKHLADNKKKRKRDRVEPISHSMLLIGAGVFVPSTPGLEHLRINYWVVKNQWGRFWADEGIGYLIRNSSLKDFHSLSRPTTRGFKQLLKTNYFPYFAYVRGQEREDPVYNSIVIREGISEKKLVKWVTGKQFREYLLIYFFYHPDLCAQIAGFNAVELITALGKTYGHDSPRVKVVLIDLTVHPTVVARFKLGAQPRALVAYLPREFYRAVSHSKRYQGEYNFGEILLWIGDTLSAREPPI